MANPSAVNAPSTDPDLIRTMAAGGMRPRVSMRGKSMAPALREGMVLELGAFERPKIALGDVIVFRERARLVAHRVVAAYDDGTLRTSGDAQPWTCESVAPIDVVGVVAAVYESGEPSAARIDATSTRVRGRLLARTRAVRAAVLRPIMILRIAARFAPWSRPKLISVLHDALMGYELGNAITVARALRDVDEDVFADFAHRHGCATLLRRALSSVQASSMPLLAITPRTKRLADALQGEARLAGLRNIALTAQVESVVAMLKAANVPFALLKGAARLYGSDADASLYGSRDIDIFVRRNDVTAAIHALAAAGYFHKANARERARYLATVHHAAPLYPPEEKGWIVEVHSRLARPHWLSTDTRWEALSDYLVPTDGDREPVLRFDRFGTALHHLIHGIGLRRYRDVWIAARAYRQLTVEEKARIASIVAAERRDRIRLSAIFALVAEAADLPLARIDPDVAAYLAWVRKRESLPRSMRRGAYAIEAWYASGARIEPIGLRIVLDEGTFLSVVARIALAPLTLAYVAFMRS